MGPSLLWASQQLIPPLLLSYFYAAWKLCTFEVGVKYITEELARPFAGRLYTCLPTLLIIPITVIYLRLYFLPQNQSVPPLNPPSEIRDYRVIFQCLAPSEADAIQRADGSSITPHSLDRDPLLDRCNKGRCAGRWKPARARHCSQCGVCRGGFDHHCPFFANCLTAPYMPAFLALLAYTNVTVFVLSLPLYAPLYRRCLAAWTIASHSEAIRSGWWDWWPSWVIAGGPVGRFAGGLILGWRELDRSDGGGVASLACGAVVAFGHILALVCVGLAYNAISAIISGDLLIDQGRTQAHMRTILAIEKLQSMNQPVPPQLIRELERWSDRKHFFIPSDSGRTSGRRSGRILPTAAADRVYDHGMKRNWQLIMGEGWYWLLPWQAVRRGVVDEILFNWPINKDIEDRLREEARRQEDTVD